MIALLACFQVACDAKLKKVRSGLAGRLGRLNRHQPAGTGCILEQHARIGKGKQGHHSKIHSIAAPLQLAYQRGQHKFGTKEESKFYMKDSVTLYLICGVGLARKPARSRRRFRWSSQAASGMVCSMYSDAFFRFRRGVVMTHAFPPHHHQKGVGAFCS
jgi:hypothetical protein